MYLKNGVPHNVEPANYAFTGLAVNRVVKKGEVLFMEGRLVADLGSRISGAGQNRFQRCGMLEQADETSGSA